MAPLMPMTNIILSFFQVGFHGPLPPSNQPTDQHRSTNQHPSNHHQTANSEPTDGNVQHQQPKQAPVASSVIAANSNQPTPISQHQTTSSITNEHRPTANKIRHQPTLKPTNTSWSAPANLSKHQRTSANPTHSHHPELPSTTNLPTPANINQ